MTVRVYVPTTMTGLRQLVQADGVGPAPFLAHAVTDAVRNELADAGEEDWAVSYTHLTLPTNSRV